LYCTVYFQSLETMFQELGRDWYTPCSRFEVFSMNLPPVLQLKKEADRRLRQGHPWVYSNEVDIGKTPLKAIPEGEQCRILNHSGKVLATAIVNPLPLICARIISRHPDTWMDKSLMVHRINIALSLRERVFIKPFYRLLYGDSDGMPGVVVDRFGDVLVVQISTSGMERVKLSLIDALNKVLRPETIIIKNDGKMREQEGLHCYTEVVQGQKQRYAFLEENGVKFQAPVLEGQKTGWFFDHRMSRARLGSYVKGKKVLDVFSYIGGWGIQAAVKGAEKVVCIDSSDFALKGVKTNAVLNGVEKRVETRKGDAFELLKQMREARQKFDVVIVDPPAFIPRRRDIKAGELAYQRINKLAMRLLEKEGLLITASCSMHLSRARLVTLNQYAARELDRNLQLVEQGTQGADHPVHPAVPETEYLKSLFFRVLPTF